MATYDITQVTVDPNALETGDIIICPYSETIKDVTLPKGKFHMECWGGGTRHLDSSKDGYGGYTYGDLILNAQRTIYCVSGGKGKVASDWKDTSPGGYNGGGNGHGAGGLVNNRQAVSGAGATHIAFRSGLLKDLASYVSDIIMVAGGAGSDVYQATSAEMEYSDNRGAGGGAVGINGNRFQETDTGGTWQLCTAAQGGSQSAGGAGGIAQYASGEDIRTGGSGSFGQGGDSCAIHTTYWLTAVWFGGGGGGGGFYGGGGGATSFYITTTASRTKQCSVSGAGGSGFISSILDNAATIEGSANRSYPDNDNGYIKITCIEIASPIDTTPSFSIKYNNSVLSTFSKKVPVDVKYANSLLIQLGAKMRKELACNGKLFSGNIAIDTKTLLTDGTIANSNIIVESTIANPTGFTSLNYVEATGSQFIDTGIVGTDGDFFTVVYDAQYDASQPNNRGLQGFGGSASEYWGVQNGYYEMSTMISSVSAGSRETIVWEFIGGDSQSLYHNGALIGTKALNSISGMHLQLFAIGGSYNMKGKLYSCHVYKNGALIADIYPYRRNSDNVAGIIDYVAEHFIVPNGTMLGG